MTRFPLLEGGFPECRGNHKNYKFLEEKTYDKHGFTNEPG